MVRRRILRRRRRLPDPVLEQPDDARGGELYPAGPRPGGPRDRRKARDRAVCGRRRSAAGERDHASDRSSVADYGGPYAEKALAPKLQAQESQRQVPLRQAQEAPSPRPRKSRAAQRPVPFRRHNASGRLIAPAGPGDSLIRLKSAPLRTGDGRVLAATGTRMEAAE